MKERIAKLIDVKSIITFAIIGVFSYLAVIGRIDAGQFMTVAIAVITFYFAKRDSAEVK